MSSLVSISGVQSISDVESTISAGGEVTLPDPVGHSMGTLFDLGDGDLCLTVNGVALETHKYLIKRFSGLKNRIRNNAITLEPGEPGAEDFQNTFKILYDSIVEEPFHFDHATLTSALRIATTYDYPALRNFAIRHLENASLSAVQRIRLAREFGLSSWEEPAYVELCNREEAITKEEASTLGLDAFVHVARIREKEQRRRGRDIDVAVEPDDACHAGEPGSVNLAAKSSKDKRRRKSVKKATSVASSQDSDSSEGEEGQAKGTSTETDKKGEGEF